MENWDDLRFVVGLARYGSMANAARHLRTNTATVSRRIKRINETSHTGLFQKGASKWELTAEGHRLYEMSSAFADDLLAFSASLKSAESTKQTIRVTGLEFLVNEILSPSLASFVDSNPKVTLELSANDRNVSLAYGEADIALRLSRPTEGRLGAKRIADIRMGVFGVAGYAGQKWIGLPFELDHTPEMKNGFEYFNCQPSLRMPSFQSIIYGMQSTGIAGIGPEVMIRKHSNFAPLQPLPEMRVREVWLLFHETRKQDQALRDTCKWIEQAFSSFDF
jgi:DNA-binding transcriptional LysR family regulator